MSEGPRGANTEAIASATGTPWPEWTAWLDAAGARGLPSHGAIAALVLDRLQDPATPDCANPAWWAQSVTVAYEQHLGRRAPGQRADGTFEASVSRTVPGSAEQVHAAVQDVFGAAVAAGDGVLRGVAVTGGPSVSVTDRRRYWRVALADGSRVDVGVEDRPARGAATPDRPARAVVAVGHRRLPSADEAAAWKGLWKELLARL